MVGGQIASLTPGPSFAYNLGCRCPNDSCKAILDIYTSRPLQRYKEYLNAKCFDPCNRLLNFWESRGTPNSHFRECEWRPHTSLKVGLRQLSPLFLGETWLRLPFCLLYGENPFHLGGTCSKSFPSLQKLPKGLFFFFPSILFMVGPIFLEKKTKP